MLRYLLELSSKNTLFHIEPVAGFQMAGMVSLILSKDMPISGEPFGLEKSRAYNYSVSGLGGSENIKNIRVIQMHGLMTMHGGPCSYGMIDYERMMWDAANDPSVSAIVIDGNTPGGEAMYTETFAKSIHEVNKIKPVVGFANQMVASAGFYAFSATEEIILSGKTAMVGSIGTLIHYLDFTRKMKAEGIDEVMILASKSTHKRKYNFSQPSEDDRKAIIEGILDPSNEVFLEDVIKYRPVIKEEALTGEVYRGQSAIDVGLADRFGSLKTAIIRAAELSENRNSKSNSQQMNTEQKENQTLINKLKAKMGLGPVVTELKEETPDQTVAPEKEDQTALIASLQEENKRLKAQLSEQDKTIKAQTSDLTTLKTEVEKLGKVVPAQELPGQSAEETLKQTDTDAELDPMTALAIAHWDEMGYK